MSCDMYVYVEVKRGSFWEFVGKRDFGRWYVMHGMFADFWNHHNVRPITSLRGLPHDCSWEIRAIYEKLERDLMLAPVSYLLISEILDYDPDYYTVDYHGKEYYVKDEYDIIINSHILPILNELKEPPENIRLILMFHF